MTGHRRAGFPSRICRFLCIFLLSVLLTEAAFVSDAQASAYRYYENHLIGTEKTICKSLRKSWGSGKAAPFMKMDGVLTLNGNIPQYVMDDNPQYFWILGGYSYLFGESVLYTRIEPWTDSYKSKAKFNRKVNKIVSSLKKKCSGKTTAQKARIIHDYICRHCSYKLSKYDQTAYGVFMKKSAVCAGYARAYKLLCDRLNVPCICVSCYVLSENGKYEGHMLNYVKIKKKWYYVDCTWDDVNGNKTPAYRYFLLGRKSAGGLRTSNGVALPQLAANDYKNYQ